LDLSVVFRENFVNFFLAQRTRSEKIPKKEPKPGAKIFPAQNFKKNQIPKITKTAKTAILNSKTQKPDGIKT